MRLVWIVVPPAVIVLILLAAGATWAFYRPIRVLAPEWAGVECLRGNICIDDPSRLVEASKLYAEALGAVQSRLGPPRQEPRIIFCATEGCSHSFGFTYQLGYTFGTRGIVISHRGWRPYTVRFELIRYLQNEHLGGTSKPAWFREGMAASLSDDPRRPMPEPLNSFRMQFDDWFGRIDKKQFWTEAARL
jgi:hypothetical protein